MHVPVIFEVKMIKADIWPVSSAHIAKSHAFKVCLVFTIMPLFVSVFLKIITSTMSFGNDFDFIPLFFMTAFCFFFFILLPFGFNYFMLNRQLNKDKIFSAQTHYEFSDEKIQITSNYKNRSIQWNEIDKVVEAKPCFFLYFSKANIIIIPRRCFSDQTQLEQFRILLQSCNATGNLHRAHFKIEQGSAETAVDTSEQLQEKMVNSESNSSIIKLKFHFNREEIIYFALRRYYTRPFGVIMTLIGIYILFDFSKLLIADKGDSYVLFLSIVYLGFELLIGLLFLFLIPFIIYSSSDNRKRKTGSFHEERIYQFGEESFSIDIGVDKTTFQWNELIKIIEKRNGYILNIAPSRSCYLPKRVFENAEDAERFNDLIKRHANQTNKK